MVARKPLPVNAVVDAAAQSQTTMQPHAHSQQQQVGPDDIWGSDTRSQPQGQQHGNPDSLLDAAPSALRPGSQTNASDGLEDENVWADSGAEVNRVPTVLRPGSGRTHAADMGAVTNEAKDMLRVPTILRPGGKRTETNPFKRSTSASEDELRGASAATGPPPVPTVPIASLSQLSLNESSNNPWQPALGGKKDDSFKSSQVPPDNLNQEPGEGVWDSTKPGPTSNSPAILSLPSDESSAGWDDEEPRKASLAGPRIPPPSEEVLEDSHAWDDLGSRDKGKKLAAPLLVTTPGSAESGEGWNLIDIDAPPGPPPTQSAWDKFIDGEEVTDGSSTSAAKKPVDGPPELPPRRSREDQAPPQPPRPVDKSETYQIKNINWYDVNSSKNPRTSPILVQNANGPCPLVALVNALSLTTPADKPNTVLVETLRSREQVSLEFLLNAVFDELMSERRTNPDVGLPDVTELYVFLKGLHTGMNVNPRFVPTPEVVTAFKRTSLTHLHPTERGDMVPGTFEHTKEMALYATFSIPLIHGWLPARGDAVYDSFTRQAGSYEDAQNLLFREEELEEKLSSTHHEGLTEEEQQIYQDILTIKSFLSISATQLTKWGLEVIRKSMMPGSVAILFRNDHFSTLYKHPQTQELLSLVTDAGYAGHPEVVWESLVDVNGERAEFFSGDFRLVGGASHAEHQHRRSSSHHHSSSHSGHVDGWTPVQGRRDRNAASQQARSESDGPPASPMHEQEDRDLALALQLQEEEDERHRTEQERRRRESLLSEQFIEQQARTPGTAGGSGTHARAGSQISLSSAPTTPNRRSSNAVNVPVTTTVANTGLRVRPAAQTVRSLIPPRAPAVNRPADEAQDDAPPSYEQAAKQTPYVPPAGHPSHPSSTPATEGAAGSSTGGNTQRQAVPMPPPVPLAGRRNTGPVPARLRPGVPQPQAAGGGGKERDCIVM